MKQINESKNSKKANATINKVLEEMNFAEEYIKNWNASWLENCSDTYSIDLYYTNLYTINELEKRYYNQYYLTTALNSDTRTNQPLKKVILYDEENNEYICEFSKIEWYGMSSNKTERTFCFQSNGDIRFSKTTKSNKTSSTKLDYSMKYNVNSNDLSVTINIDGIIIKAEFYDNILYIEYNDLKIETNMVNGTRKLSYEKEKQNNQSAIIEIVLDKNNQIISKSIQIKNYDYDNQIISEYEFNFEYDKLIEVLYTSKIEQEFNMLNDSDLTNLANEILLDFYTKNPQFDIDSKTMQEIINSKKEQLFKVIKLIKGDIPLYGLSKRLDISLAKLNNKIETHEEEKKTTKKKSKRRKNNKCLYKN